MISELASKMYYERLDQIELDIKKAARKKLKEIGQYFTLKRKEFKKT